MPLLYYVQTAVVGLAITLTIGIHMMTRKGTKFDLRGIFLCLLGSNMLLLVLELLLNVLTGDEAAFARTFLSGIVCLFYIMNPIPEALWIFYLDATIRRNEQKGMSKKTAVIIYLPIAANAILSLCSVFGGYLFYVDADNVYHRGALFLIMPALCYIYLFYYIALILKKRKFISRREFLALLFSAFPPLAAGVLQSMFFGLSILWTALAFSLLIVYMNVQSEQVYKELLKLDRLKDQFLANTSHELRTPLNGIINMASTVLVGNPAMSATQRHHLEMVVAAARRLNHLINDILDITGMKTGEMKLRRRAVDLKSVADSSLYIVSQLNNGKEIDFINKIPDSLPPVLADEERLYQIFYNLIGNALKFTVQGEIAVGASLRQGDIEVWVEDTGVGISAEQLEDVFKPFFQADATETREAGGVGLGLSITRTLVELHEGTIRIVSKPGQGSRVLFTLPLCGEPEEQSRSSSPRQPSLFEVPAAAIPSPVGRKEKDSTYSILAADDDPINLSVLFHMLDHEGYDVTAVADGDAVLAELERHRHYDLVILDIMMPKTSGLEVLTRIREQFQSMDLPVLLLTARARPEDLQAGFAAGANDYLTKPFEALELMSRVKTLVQLKQSVSNRMLAELSFLQAQIKPHFLFNTLNVITALCIQQPDRAQKLLYDLSDYLRGSFNFDQYGGITPLASELETVQAYVSIEMERFGGRLAFESDVDTGIQQLKVPMLIIQPLIENAIRHGIMRKANGGKVRLSIRKEDEYAVIKVQDNGIGISVAKLSVLLNRNGSSSGVGLVNIQRRMMLRYGHGLNIQSVLGQGTTVELKLPLKDEAGAHAANRIAR